MVAMLATRFPGAGAYQATIIRAERNYEGKQWVTYDHQYHQQALAKKEDPPPRRYAFATTKGGASIINANTATPAVPDKEPMHS